jgi:hypothetical protein
MGGLETMLVPDPEGDGFCLNGEMFYSTGSIYSDWTQQAVTVGPCAPSATTPSPWSGGRGCHTSSARQPQHEQDGKSAAHERNPQINNRDDKSESFIEPNGWQTHPPPDLDTKMH